jgi:hypothetical protein
VCFTLTNYPHSTAAIKSILNLLLLLFDETDVLTEVDDVADDPINADANDLDDLLLLLFVVVALLPPKLCVRLCRRRSQLRRKTLPQLQW